MYLKLFFRKLLNSIKILIIDPAGLSWELLSLAVAPLTAVYKLDFIPLLIYPSDCYSVDGPSYEKKYHLWILNMSHSNKLEEYMQRHFRMRYE